MTVCRKRVIGKRKDHRCQTEDGCANRDDGQAVHVNGRHRRLYQEVVVLDGLVHVIHFSAGPRGTVLFGRMYQLVPEWANLVSCRGRMWW